MQRLSIQVLLFFVLACLFVVASVDDEAAARKPKATKAPTLPFESFKALLGSTPLPVGAPLPTIITNFTSKLGAAVSKRIGWDGTLNFILNGSAPFEGASRILPRDFFLKGGGKLHIFTSGENEKAAVEIDADAYSQRIYFEPLKPNKNRITVTFTSDDAGTPGLAQTFSAVFIHVFRAKKQGLRFFDKNGKLLANIRCIGGYSKQFQIIGALFEEPVIAKVIIDFDTKYPGSVVDDFFFDQSSTPF